MLQENKPQTAGERDFTIPTAAEVRGVALPLSSGLHGIIAPVRESVTAALTFYEPERLLDILDTAERVESLSAIRKRISQLPVINFDPAQSNDLSDRWKRARQIIRDGEIQTGESEALLLVADEVRECMTEIARDSVISAFGELRASEFQCSERSECDQSELIAALNVYTQSLPPALRALAMQDRSKGALPKRDAQELATALGLATYGVGVYYGAQVRSIRVWEEVEEVEYTERTSDWKEMHGSPTRSPVRSNVSSAAMFSTDIRELNPVDLGSTWVDLEKALFTGKQLTEQQAVFIWNVQHRIREFLSIYAGGLASAVMDDLERDGMEARHPAMAHLEEARTAIRSGQVFSNAVEWAIEDIFASA